MRQIVPRVRRVLFYLGCIAGIGCSAAPEQDDEFSGATKQSIVPSAPLCDATKDRCSVGITVPIGVNALDVALGGLTTARANDRVQLTGSSTNHLPVMLSVGKVERSRVGMRRSGTCG